jgi:predicted transposase YdaD
VRDLLGQVMEFWFFERFRALTAKEIWSMLNLTTPIQETRAYQSIFAEGEAEGEARGRIEGERNAKAATVRRLLTRRFGLLPAWAERRIESAPIERLDTWLDGILDTPNLDDLLGPTAAD